MTNKPPSITEPSEKIPRDIYWGGLTEKEVLEIADKYVGHWVKNTSKKDFDYFVEWARNTGVYFPDTPKTWDAFRGYCVSLRHFYKQLDATTGNDFDHELKSAKSYILKMNQNITQLECVIAEKQAELDVVKSKLERADSLLKEIVESWSHGQHSVKKTLEYFAEAGDE